MTDYLKAVSGIFYYWRKVPLDLNGYFHGKHFKISMRTRLRNEAKMKSTNFSMWLNRIFAIIRSGAFSQEELDKIKLTAPFELEPSEQKKAKATRQQIPTILSLYDMYENEHLRNGRWREKTRTDQRQMIRLFVELLGGNCQIGKVTRQCLLQIREQICRLPPNLTKDKRFRNKSLAAILILDDYKPMSHIRAHRILSHLGAFLKWSYNHGFIDSDISSGLYMAKKRDTRQNEEREIYSDDDLRRLFATEIFQGIGAINRPECFFLPILAMYTGARLNELAQLYVEDVQNIEGIPCININDSHDKVLKNPGSRRIVPIHPTLIEIGFGEYVAAIRKLGLPRLWMNLTFREDNYGKKFSSFYQRLNRKSVTDNPRKVFHSFRHGFANALKQNAVRSEVISELLGHAHGSITLDRYGKPLGVKMLFDAVKTIKFAVPERILQHTAYAIIKNLLKTDPQEHQ